MVDPGNERNRNVAIAFGYGRPRAIAIADDGSVQVLDTTNDKGTKKYKWMVKMQDDGQFYLRHHTTRKYLTISGTGLSLLNTKEEAENDPNALWFRLFGPSGYKCLGPQGGFLYFDENPYGLAIENDCIYDPDNGAEHVIIQHYFARIKNRKNSHSNSSS
eukprot:Awhi_evm1s12369